MLIFQSLSFPPSIPHRHISWIDIKKRVNTLRLFSEQPSPQKTPRLQIPVHQPKIPLQSLAESFFISHWQCRRECETGKEKCSFTSPSGKLVHAFGPCSGAITNISFLIPSSSLLWHLNVELEASCKCPFLNLITWLSQWYCSAYIIHLACVNDPFLQLPSEYKDFILRPVVLRIVFCLALLILAPSHSFIQWLTKANPFFTVVPMLLYKVLDQFENFHDKEWLDWKIYGNLVTTFMFLSCLKWEQIISSY